MAYNKDFFECSYDYGIEVLKVYDGDTITNATVWTDIGFKERHTWYERKIRLYGINCKEMRDYKTRRKRTEAEKENAKAARDLLRFFTQSDCQQELVFESHKDSTGSFARWLGTIWVMFPVPASFTGIKKTKHEFAANRWIDVNTWFLQNGYAIPYKK